MGIRPEWIKVADAIGFEAFIAAWQVLAAQPLDERGRITVPAMKNYYNFQRNEVIRSLASAGHNSLQIREHFRQVHKTELSKSVVLNVVSKMRA